MMNKRGIALLVSYIVIMVLTILGSAFVVRSVSEANIARSYANSMQAFWIAEAGLSQAYYNWFNDNELPVAGTYYFNGHPYTIDASLFPEVTVNSTVGGRQRTIQALFVRIPAAFENTLSVGKNLSLTGLWAKAEVYGKTRITGSYIESGAQGTFEDKQTGIGSDYTTIKIPDYNNNGSTDEFSDFILFGQYAVQSYPAEGTVYIQSNGTVNIFPNQNLVGKKIVFVQGSKPGKGAINIFFDGTWNEGEDLTLISTGKITYMQPLQFQEEARLSTVSWDDYVETSIFRSQHESVIYTHDKASFVDILDWGSTTGNIISNDNTSLLEVLSYEKYYYSDRAKNGDMPPGFKWLPGQVGTAKLLDWHETP